MIIFLTTFILIMFTNILISLVIIMLIFNIFLLFRLLDSKNTKEQSIKNEAELNNTIKNNLSNLNENIIKNQSGMKFLYNQNNDIVKTLSPIRETLITLNSNIRSIEVKRGESLSMLYESIKDLNSNTNRLHKETINLSTALSKPNVRGRWGELQLKRVLEISGMLEYCDFELQSSISNSSKNKSIRPDAIVKISEDKNIIIDAKVPLESYLQSFNTEDETTKHQLLQKHSEALKDKVKDLSKKEYWSYLPSSIEFVVIFVPSENIFTSAVDFDPSLLEFSWANNVIIATPGTLLSLLKTTAYTWNQVKIEKNAQKIQEQAQDLYNKIAIFSEHVKKIGDSIENASKHYNNSVASLERNVFSSLRKFEENGVSSNKKIEFKTVDTPIRELKSQKNTY